MGKYCFKSFAINNFFPFSAPSFFRFSICEVETGNFVFRFNLHYWRTFFLHISVAYGHLGKTDILPEDLHNLVHNSKSSKVQKEVLGSIWMRHRRFEQVSVRHVPQYFRHATIDSVYQFSGFHKFRMRHFITMNVFFSSTSTRKR